jgi:hypothetical protein
MSGQPLIITQLFKPANNDNPMTLTLQDASMPLQGVSEQTSLRMLREDYPGADGASFQIMGTEEKPMMFKGWLRDVQLGGIGFARREYDILRKMLYGQTYCRLEWGTDFVKSGLIKDVKGTFARSQDIMYELVFEVSTDESEPTVHVPEEYHISTRSTLAQTVAVMRTVTAKVDKAFTILTVAVGPTRQIARAIDRAT